MNAQNEPGSWAEDFSYDYLERVSRQIMARFRLATLGDAEEALASTVPVAFVRHDIDLSLDRAVELARREHDWGLVSTYHVMIDCPFYDIRDRSSLDTLAELDRLGHEVGLHYDVQARSMLQADPGDREADIAAACEQLESLTAAPVCSVSFHRPLEELLDGPLRVGGRISGYASELFRWYISDSRARWREGPPIESLDQPRSHVLQILTHPVWWGNGHLAPELRLREFVAELAQRQGANYETVRDAVTDHVAFRAAD